MTREEAIKHYKENVCKYCCEWKPELRYCENCPTAVAIECIERQIPKAPDLEGDGYSPEGTFVYDTWICPKCETHYEVDYDDYKYCPNCGQAILRSDTE